MWKRNDKTFQFKLVGSEKNKEAENDLYSIPILEKRDDYPFIEDGSTEQEKAEFKRQITEAIEEERLKDKRRKYFSIIIYFIFYYRSRGPPGKVHTL